MYRLTQKQFIDFFKDQPETGMGYWVVTVVLRDGRQFERVVVDSGFVSQVKDYEDIPFAESEIDHFIVTHDKWDFRR